MCICYIYIYICIYGVSNFFRQPNIGATSRPDARRASLRSRRATACWLKHVSLYIYIYLHVCVCIYIYIYVSIYSLINIIVIIIIIMTPFGSVNLHLTMTAFLDVYVETNKCGQTRGYHAAPRRGVSARASRLVTPFGSAFDHLFNQHIRSPSAPRRARKT